VVCDQVNSKVGSFSRYRKSGHHSKWSSDNAIFQKLQFEIQYIALQVISLIRHATFA